VPVATVKGAGGINAPMAFVHGSVGREEDDPDREDLQMRGLEVIPWQGWGGRCRVARDRPDSDVQRNDRCALIANIRGAYLAVGYAVPGEVRPTPAKSHLRLGAVVWISLLSGCQG
jgi:hypothetical protein